MATMFHPLGEFLLVADDVGHLQVHSSSPSLLSLVAYLGILPRGPFRLPRLGREAGLDVD